MQTFEHNCMFWIFTRVNEVQAIGEYINEKVWLICLTACSTITLLRMRKMRMQVAMTTNNFMRRVCWSLSQNLWYKSSIFTSWNCFWKEKCIEMIIPEFIIVVLHCCLLTQVSYRMHRNMYVIESQKITH